MLCHNVDWSSCRRALLFGTRVKVTSAGFDLIEAPYPQTHGRGRLVTARSTARKSTPATE